MNTFDVNCGVLPTKTLSKKIEMLQAVLVPYSHIDGMGVYFV